LPTRADPAVVELSGGRKLGFYYDGIDFTGVDGRLRRVKLDYDGSKIDIYWNEVRFASATGVAFRHT
jgi:hypothetical protein